MFRTPWGIQGSKTPLPQECKLVQPPWRTVWRFLRKLQIELPYDPAIPLLSIYDPAIPPLGMHLDKAVIQKDACSSMFTASLFTTAKTKKQPKCPSIEE